MSVTVRPYRRGGWEVDIGMVLPDGTRWRERRRAPVSSKTAALRWGQARERERLIRPPTGQTQPRKEVPTLQEFAPRFIEGHAKADRQKPSSVAAKEMILRLHLAPPLGAKRLDAITTEDVQQLKSVLTTKAPKTVNNILTVLNTMLKAAVEWNVIEQLPCTIRLVTVPKPSAVFHDFDTYARLLAAARKTDPDTHLSILLGGDGGLRLGEMIALKWTDVDVAKRQMCVQRSDWNGHVTTPKNGRLRHIPLTVRLAAALREHRHLRSPLVLCDQRGQPIRRRTLQNWVRRAARRAKVQNSGVHVLRHTFCSHLAMRGAPARAIQELAGHADLATTQRYMHLSPAALESAIRLLDQPVSSLRWGDIGETADLRSVTAAERTR